MDSQSSRKRSSTVKKEEPTKRRMEEKEPEANIPSSYGGSKVPSKANRWDDIGEEEEMYLTSTREELYELIMKKRDLQLQGEGEE